MTIELARSYADKKLFHKALPILHGFMRQEPPLRGAHLEYARVVNNIAFNYLALEAARKEYELFGCPEASALAASIEGVMKSKQRQVPEHELISLVAISRKGEESDWMRCFESLSLQMNSKIEVCLVSDTSGSEWGELPPFVVVHPSVSRPFNRREEISRAINLAQGQVISVIERPRSVFSDPGLLMVAAAFYTLPNVEVLQTERVYPTDKLVFEGTRWNRPLWCQALLLDPFSVEPPTLMFSWRGVFFRKHTLQALLPFQSGIEHALALDVAARFVRKSQVHTIAIPALLDDTPCEGRSYQLDLREVADAKGIIARERAMLTPDSSIEPAPLINPFNPTPPNARLPKVSAALLQGGRAAAPAISLVTSVYNGRDYLERCIDSILSQAYPNLEYIILDGGSTDGTQEIIKRYERYLAFWRSGPDNGHYASVQEGLTRSTGEIMSWLNADDRLTPYSLDLVAALFTGAKEMEWLTGRQCVSSVDDTLDVGGVPHLTGESYFDDGFDIPFIQQEGTFWRRSLWERAGGALDVRLELAADMELWTRFFQHAHPYTTSVPLGIFQMRPGQRSEVFRSRYYNEAFGVVKRLKMLGIKPFYHPEPEATRLPIPVEPD